MALGLKRGTVELVEYNPEWAELYLVEKAELERELGDELLGVEHVGSTAIPGMLAKPILDVAVAVNSLDGFERFTPQFEELGYQFMRDNRDDQEHVLYVKGSEEARTHYLKLTTLDSGFWKHHVLFRDYLIDHPAPRPADSGRVCIAGGRGWFPDPVEQSRSRFRASCGSGPN